MPKVSFELDGALFTQRISSFERDKINDLEKITKRGSQRMAKAAKRAAPVSGGRTVRRGGTQVRIPGRQLRQSIRAKDVSKRLGRPERLSHTVTARGAKGNHLHLVTLGTSIRSTKRPIAPWGTMRGRMTANDFMARAEQSITPSYNAEIRARLMRKVVI